MYENKVYCLNRKKIFDKSFSGVTTSSKYKSVSNMDKYFPQLSKNRRSEKTRSRTNNNVNSGSNSQHNTSLPPEKSSTKKPKALSPTHAEIMFPFRFSPQNPFPLHNHISFTSPTNNNDNQIIEKVMFNFFLLNIYVPLTTFRLLTTMQ